MREEFVDVNNIDTRQWLGLTDHEAISLFHNEINPWSYHENGERKYLGYITRAETVEYLDKCIEAGKLV